VTEPAPRQAADAGYLERLRTPWWWYPLAILAAVLLGAEFDVVMPQFLVGVPVLVAIVIPVGLVWRLSRGAVRVADGRVTAGGRSIAVAEIDQLYPLRAEELRQLVGRHGDPSAYTFVRPWAPAGVQLVLTPRPAGEREPYWVLSSRHPDRLAAAIQAAR